MVMKVTFLFLNLAKIHIFIPKSAYGGGGSAGLGIIPKKDSFFSAFLRVIYRFKYQLNNHFNLLIALKPWFEETRIFPSSFFECLSCFPSEWKCPSASQRQLELLELSTAWAGTSCADWPCSARPTTHGHQL